MYSESIGSQDKQFLTYLNLGKSCLEVAQDKLKYYKDCGDVGGISSLEDIFAECERAIDSLLEAMNLRKESFRDFKQAGDILNLHEILNECERGINFLSEAISLREERDVEHPEIQRIKTKVQQVWDETKQYSMQAKWEAQTTTLIKEELKKFKDQINGRLPINDLEIMISYVDEGSKTNKTISMLKLIFETLGISITSKEYQDLTTFEKELKKYTHAIILATSKYKEVAAPTGKEGEQLRKVLNEFGDKENGEENVSAKLHVLLCDSDYSKVASQIVDAKYLVRPYQTVFNGKKVWYELANYPILDSELQDGKICITKESNNAVKYKLKNLMNRDNPDEPDKPIEEGNITTEELAILSEVMECNQDDLLLEKINKLLPDILRITTQRGHTLKECIANFQEQLPFLDFIEHLLNPLSYEYESGMLPSILDITDQKHRDIYEEYKIWFKKLTQKQKMLNIKYRLNEILISSIQKDKKALPLIDLDDTKQANLEELEKQVEDIINNLLQSSNLKSNLILCQKGSDHTLVNLLLKTGLMLKKDVIVVAVDCGRQYKDDVKTPAYAVNGFLKEKLYLNEYEIEELTKQTTEKVVILFENYERLGVYENLYVKNELSKWLQLKMLITCDKDFFQHRDYASCILPDPGFMDLNTIKCDEIEGVLRDEIFRKSSIVDRSMIVSYNFDESWRKESKIDRMKRYAQHSELNIFLKNIHSYFQDKIEGIKNAEQIFISYAWEQHRGTMIRKQNLLAKIAADLQTLGFFVWLDIERLASNIDQQLDRNILKSRYAFIIGTPSYTKKAADDKTYVCREFNKIIAKKQQRSENFDVFHIKFLEEDGVKSFAAKKQLDFKENQVDFCGIDDEGEYIKKLASFAEGLIPKLMGLHTADCDQELKEKYIKYYEQMQKQLALLPASHLLVDKGQEDVQSYDIDGRLEVYIEPSGVTVNPTHTTMIKEQFNLEKSLRDFLQNPNLKTYVALGDAGSGKTLFTLWTFKKYVLQPWHNYRNKNLEIYLCSNQPDKANIKMNAIYLYLEENQIQYICLVKNYKHESDQETQIVTIDAKNLAIYQQIKQELTNINGKKPLSSDYEINEFFNLLKPKWLPIYIPLKNYSYSGESGKKEEQQTPQRYIEDALLTDYHISPQDLLELKKGLGYEQNILFILDGYDELGKGNNPNFSQALLNGYEDILLCPQRPNEEEIKEDFIYIYLNKEKIHLLIKKTEHTGKASIIDKEITEATLSEELKKHFLEIQTLIPAEPVAISEATVIEKFFVYTAKNHQRDLKAHGLRWKYAKIFVTGRPEHFDNEGKQHLEAFAILDKHNPISDSFKVNYMARFTSEEIEAYINKYKQADPKCEQELAKLEKTHSKTTFEILESFGNLKELLINPFLLNITLQALPMLIKKTDISVTRASIYEAFIEYWYTKEIARKGRSLSSCSTAECYQFAEQLAMQMFIYNTISISEKKPELWEFFNRLDHTFAREVCPLRRSGNEYSFIHKSVYEYLLARYLMTNNWQDIQQLTISIQYKINSIDFRYTSSKVALRLLKEEPNGFGYEYNNSIARLFREEPSVFSFIKDFTKPFICVKKIESTPTSSDYIKKQNLYKIFLELLRWNEQSLAVNLISNISEYSFNDPEKELKFIFSKNVFEEKNNELDITNKELLAAAIDVWLGYKEKFILLPKYLDKIKNNLPLFLSLVGWGEQTIVELILKVNPSIAEARGELIDCTGRTYKNITAFQYSVWALDYHMWNMIGEYLTIEQKSLQLSEIKQIAQLNTEGWIKIYETAIDWPIINWTLLIKALDGILGNFYHHQSPPYKIIGNAQLFLPAHVINEYNHPNRSFCPDPKWAEQEEEKLPRIGLNGWLAKFKDNKKYVIGRDFAWKRGSKPNICDSDGDPWGVSCDDGSAHVGGCGYCTSCQDNEERLGHYEKDEQALSKLRRVRIRQALELIQSLTNHSSIQAYQALREQVYLLRSQYIDEKVTKNIKHYTGLSIYKNGNDWIALSQEEHIAIQTQNFYYDLKVLKEEAKRQWPSPCRPRL